GLRALVDPARRSVSAGRGIFHDERDHQRRVLRVRLRRADRQRLGAVSPRTPARGAGPTSASRGKAASGRRARPPLIVAITGASGAPYAVRLLRLLAAARRPMSLIV